MTCSRKRADGADSFFNPHGSIPERPFFLHRVRHRKLSRYAVNKAAVAYVAKERRFRSRGTKKGYLREPMSVAQTAWTELKPAGPRARALFDPFRASRIPILKRQPPRDSAHGCLMLGSRIALPKRALMAGAGSSRPRGLAAGGGPKKVSNPAGSMTRPRSACCERGVVRSERRLARVVISRENSVGGAGFLEVSKPASAGTQTTRPPRDGGNKPRGGRFTARPTAESSWRRRSG